MKNIFTSVFAMLLLLNVSTAQNQTEKNVSFFLYIYPAPKKLKIPELNIKIKKPGEKIEITSAPKGVYSITIIADERTRNSEIEITKDSIFALGYDFQTDFYFDMYFNPKDNIPENSNDFFNLYDGCKSIAFVKVDEMPKFNNGDLIEFRRYIAKNMNYPKQAQIIGAQGRVYVQFVVNCEGEVDNVKVVRGVVSSLDAEAIRVIQTSPKWTPGLLRNRPVNVRFVVPISFSLQ